MTAPLPDAPAGLPPEFLLPGAPAATRTPMPPPGAPAPVPPPGAPAAAPPPMPAPCAAVPVSGPAAPVPGAAPTAPAPPSAAPPIPGPAAPAPPSEASPAGGDGAPRAGGGRPRRTFARVAAAAGCLVLGLGLLGGAVAGSWLSDGSDGEPSAEERYAQARGVWGNVPVDRLFPRILHGPGAGPGGADRTWTRIAVAPDSSCGGAFDPLLDRALSPVGCKRLLRATYTDATSSGVTTVGILVTKADAPRMRALRKRFSTERLDRRADLMPRPYAAKGTPAASFTDEQRATWQIDILTDMPAVVYSVTGFADGRKVADPRPAGAADRRTSEAPDDRTATMPARSGLAQDAQGVAAGIRGALRAAAARAAEEGTP
ncbi:hypothetical protein ACZ90_34750 [Streptomyces albus subsp. albus]|nr:hypothetical protein ACZ90_34750 [Streptomyces albus subsp. albus]